MTRKKFYFWLETYPISSIYPMSGYPINDLWCIMIHICHAKKECLMLPLTPSTFHSCSECSHRSHNPQISTQHEPLLLLDVRALTRHTFSFICSWRRHWYRGRVRGLRNAANNVDPRQVLRMPPPGTTLGYKPRSGAKVAWMCSMRQPRAQPSAPTLCGAHVWRRSR